MLKEAAEFILRHQEFLLIAHISPDGDTLGSCLALASAMKSAGKQACVVCEDPVPELYAFLPGAGSVLMPGNARQTEAVIAVDCADIRRTGCAERLFRNARETLCIDHHGTNTGFADVNLIERRSAAAELIAELMRELAWPMSPEIGVCLYTAISTDTGNFSYNGTTADTFRVMAEIMETGFDLPETNRLLFRTIPLRKVRLRNLVVGRMQLYRNDAVAVSYVTLEELASCGARDEDCEGIIDSIRDIDTVEAAAFLRESADGSIRVSLRGKRTLDVGKISARFQGGGHRLAAGCTLNTDMEHAVRAVTAALLEEYDGVTA